MTHFIETKIKHHKTLENGKQKTITETYIFRAESFTEAEARAVQYANDIVAKYIADSVADIRLLSHRN